MRLMAIDQLTEGMQVARSVIHDSGRTLLTPGVLLTDHMIGRLKDQGIRQVWVEAEGSDEGALSAEMAIQMERTLERRFAHVCHDPLMQQIKAIVQKRLRARVRNEAG